MLHELSLCDINIHHNYRKNGSKKPKIGKKNVKKSVLL